MSFAGPNPLAALLAARGGAPQQDDSGQDDSSEQSVTDLINRMIDLGTQAAQQEKDPIERAEIAKIVATLHGFSAREQKQRDSAMGAGPAVQLLRRQQG